MRGIFLGLVCVIAALATPAAAQKRLALVIGNDRYDSVATLQKAVNDARAVGEHLSRLGYEVIKLENGTRRQMNEKIDEFAAKVGRGDTAAFFFAGHGVAIRDTNFLLPIDVPPAREGQDDLISRESISASSIVDTLEDRGARVVFMVLDACRDNPFKTASSRGVGGTRGLAQMQTQDGVFVLYSAGIGQTALDRLGDDDANPNSVFTRTFVQLMDQPGLSVQELAKSTQSAVRRLAASVNHFQMPAYYDQIDGVITLAATAAAAKPAAKPAVPDGPGSGRPFTATIKIKHSGKCVDLFNASKDNTSPAVQWGCSGGDNQKWDFIPLADGYYTIKAHHSGKCMDIGGASTNWAVVVWQWDCAGVDNQKFKLTPNGTGYYHIMPKHSGLCLDILGGVQDNSAVLWQWGCHDGDNQRFQIIVQ